MLALAVALFVLFLIGTGRFATYTQLIGLTAPFLGSPMDEPNP